MSAGAMILAIELAMCLTLALMLYATWRPR